MIENLGFDRLTYSETQDGLIQSVLFKRLEKQIESGSGPSYVLENPHLLGQVLHAVIPGVNVYLMHCEETASDTCFVKIGVAKDIAKRWSGVNCDCPLRVSAIPYFCLNGSRLAYGYENALHKTYARYHHANEWFVFRSAEERSSAVQEICGQMQDWLKEDYFCFEFDTSIEPNDARVQKIRKYCSDAVMLIKAKFDSLR